MKKVTKKLPTTKTITIAKNLLLGNTYAKKTEKVTIPALPDAVKVTDLSYPSWKAKGGAKHYSDPSTHQSADFELWYSTGFGWCIPTLSIGTSRRANQGHSGGERTYAVRVSTGETVRIGNGPHVTARVKVYVRVNRVEKLRALFELQNSGAERANTIRDRISTRRAQGAMRRSYW